MTAPVFAVVGHVNRGKSSVVSTLSADPSVAVDDTPGTTRAARAYPMRVDDEVLYTLYDTPGFERARHVLAWLRERETGTGERAALVRRFVDEHAGTGEFAPECELLKPILDGAGILYVVDASIPATPAVEAETEILRWTGRPRMALLNPIGERDFSAQWRPILDQYFSLVRVFDAHEADFARRIGLLRSLGELSEDWRPAIDRAIEVLDGDRGFRLRESARVVADALVDLVTHCEEKRLDSDAASDPEKSGLEARYYAQLAERELRLRRDLRRLHLHDDLQVEQAVTDAASVEQLDEDLFDLTTWSQLGLSRSQLAAAGAAAGAVVGAGVDVSVGGSSLLLGTAVGGIAGAASALWGFGQLAQVRVLGLQLGGRLLRIGPMSNRNFPWVILDRALVFHAAVAHRAHARRTPVDLRAAEGVVAALPRDVRGKLESAFEVLRKSPGPDALHAATASLAGEIEAILREREPGRSPPTPR